MIAQLRTLYLQKCGVRDAKFEMLAKNPQNIEIYSVDNYEKLLIIQNLRYLSLVKFYI